MSEEMRDLSLKAITESAEILGIDPFRLARFLSNGLIADVLQSMGEVTTKSEGIETLARSLQAFLEDERAKAREPRDEAGNGG